MNESKYKVLLLDAANTIIHKPKLISRFLEALNEAGIAIEEEILRRRHKLISEVVDFPDQTSEQFYAGFNSELLLSLGIIPSEELLKDIFNKCTYLPWERFPDTNILANVSQKTVILSNFNSTLENKLKSIFNDNIFDLIIGSEVEGVRKPHLDFYERAISKLGVQPSEILYVGDSIKLDIIPAKKSGIDALLIDRDNNFPLFNKRITSLYELSEYI